MDTSLYRRRAANFIRLLWTMSGEGSSAYHTVCDGTSVYNGHLQGPVTLTPTCTAEHFAVKLSIPVLKTEVCRDWAFRLLHVRSIPMRHRRGKMLTVISHKK